jgi:hypothetical protein
MSLRGALQRVTPNNALHGRAKTHARERGRWAFMEK